MIYVSKPIYYIMLSKHWYAFTEYDKRNDRLTGISSDKTCGALTVYLTNLIYRFSYKSLGVRTHNTAPLIVNMVSNPGHQGWLDYTGTTILWTGYLSVI